ncbi:MAG: iron-sulfur cluster assembly accessory protein [Pseudomonadota bacterium]
MARPKPQAITLTDRAADRIRAIIEGSDKGLIGVRLGVRNGGCAGMAYTLDYATEQNALDEIVDTKGVRVLIDPKAILFLLGTEMDFEETTLSSGFVFNNPNQVDACGCGESVNLKPAEV